MICYLIRHTYDLVPTNWYAFNTYELVPTNWYASVTYQLVHTNSYALLCTSSITHLDLSILVVGLTFSG